jgi:oxygen-dependent protoporphyrinogen oxidase
MKRIALIGSGITALARAWQLKQSGHVCDVLESSAQIGGAIQSHREGAYLAEEGPNSLQVNSAAVDQFLKSIPGFEERVLVASTQAKKRFILRGGQPHAVPTGPISAITTQLWSFSGKLRVLKEPFIAPIAAEQEESAADFVRRRLGDELYRYAINPLIGGIYAGDPEQLSLRYAFPKLYALEQNHGGMIRGAIAKMRASRQSQTAKFDKRILSFQDGLAELPQLLAAALGKSLHLQASIESIQATDGGWSIQWNGAAHNYDEVILTTPAHALERLPLPEAILTAMQPLQAIDYPPVSVLSLAFKRAEVAHALDGFGMLVPECEGRSILGVLFPSSLFANRAPADEALLTIFIGGERQPECASADTETTLASVLPELKELLGISGAPTFVHHKYWQRAIPQYKLGYGQQLANMAQIEATYPGLRLAGNYRDGISLSYCIEAAVKA